MEVEVNSDQHVRVVMGARIVAVIRHIWPKDSFRHDAAGTASATREQTVNLREGAGRIQLRSDINRFLASGRFQTRVAALLPPFEIQAHPPSG